MMKALVFNGRVVEVSADVFPVASSMEWVDCDETVQAGYTYDGSFHAPQADLMAHLDETRWQREVGGITVGGLPVLTRDRDKTLITGKITEALIKGTPDTDTFTFTLNGTDVQLTIGQLKAVGVAIAVHVQRTVDAAALVRPEIADDTLTTPEEIEAAFDAAYEAITGA
ncbi:MAG: DUF4376 domain-containing protein [Alphaproteobacteria bacterium]|nr:DUF4376 domain-containing protein [Alphaproteobacteria bacterium]